MSLITNREPRSSGRHLLVASALVALALTGCSSSNGGNASDADVGGDGGAATPTPPVGVTLAPGSSLFRLDTSKKVHDAVLHGAPAGASLTSELCSSGGKRRHVLKTSQSGQPIEIASCDWVYPAVGVALTADRWAVCFNRLTGSVGAGGRPPHPSAGMTLNCRRVEGGVAAAEVGSPETVPAWLMDLEAVDATHAKVTLFVNAAGWLVGPASPGDGIYTRTFDGERFDKAVRVPIGP